MGTEKRTTETERTETETAAEDPQARYNVTVTDAEKAEPAPGQATLDDTAGDATPDAAGEESGARKRR